LNSFQNNTLFKAVNCCTYLKCNIYIFPLISWTKLTGLKYYFNVFCWLQGGEGSQGLVCEVQDRTTSWRCVVGVLWESGSECQYRLGADGKVDIQAVEPVIGGEWYCDHLPKLSE
jgi:Mib_herc2